MILEFIALALIVIVVILVLLIHQMRKKYASSKNDTRILNTHKVPSMVYYDKKSKKLKVVQRGEHYYTNSISMHDVHFFAIDEAHVIFKERMNKGMSKDEARFPHSFMIGYVCDEPHQNTQLWLDMHNDISVSPYFMKHTKKERLHYARKVHIDGKKRKYLPYV